MDILKGHAKRRPAAKELRFVALSEAILCRLKVVGYYLIKLQKKYHDNALTFVSFFKYSVIHFLLYKQIDL